MTYPASIALLHELAANGDPTDVWGMGNVHIFTCGGCALYATALVARHPTWRVMSDGKADCIKDECSDYGHNVCACKVRHFYAISPDGRLHDITGAHDFATVQERHTVWSINDEILSNVMESWYDFHLAENFAALAVALTDA